MKTLGVVVILLCIKQGVSQGATDGSTGHVTREDLEKHYDEQKHFAQAYIKDVTDLAGRLAKADYGSDMKEKSKKVFREGHDLYSHLQEFSFKFAAKLWGQLLFHDQGGEDHFASEDVGCSAFYWYWLQNVYEHVPMDIRKSELLMSFDMHCIANRLRRFFAKNDCNIGNHTSLEDAVEMMGTIMTQLFRLKDMGTKMFVAAQYTFPDFVPDFGAQQGQSQTEKRGDIVEQLRNLLQERKEQKTNLPEHPLPAADVTDILKSLRDKLKRGNTQQESQAHDAFIRNFLDGMKKH